MITIPIQSTMTTIPIPDFIDLIARSDMPLVNCRTLSSVFWISDGWLVGFDTGEWGGALYWFSRSGDLFYKIVTANIFTIFEYSGEIVAFWGYAHMGVNNGGILKMVPPNSDSQWKAVIIKRLPSAPSAVRLLPDGTLFVPVKWGDTYCIIQPDWEMEVIKPNKYFKFVRHNIGLTVIAAFLLFIFLSNIF